MLGDQNKELYVPGVGGAIAAVFDLHNSFVVVGNETSLESNVAQYLGGAVYMYSDEKECNISTKNDAWDQIMTQYGGGEGAVRPCEVSFPSNTDGGNEAVLGGQVLAWAGQPAYKTCCSSADGSVMQCAEGPRTPPECGNAGKGTGASLFVTLPAQVLVYNTSCLNLTRPCSKYEKLSAAGSEAIGLDCWLQRDSGVEDKYDGCLLGFSEAPAYSNSRFNETYHAKLKLGRLYSGWQLDLTAVVIDGYGRVMSMSKPNQGRAVELADPDPGHGGQFDHVPAAVAAAAASITPPLLNLAQTDTGLFVIGNLTASLGLTAQFRDLSLQPVKPPRENYNYSFALVAGEGSSILRQVSKA